MKKVLHFLLIIFLSCWLTSCQNTPPNLSDHAPSDEASNLGVFVAENSELKMEIFINGYASESLNQTFYVKNGDPFEINVTIKNYSKQDIYVLNSTTCHTAQHAYDHELAIHFQNTKGESLSLPIIHDSHPEAKEIWCLSAGHSYNCSFEIYPEINSFNQPFVDFFGTITFSYSLVNDGLQTKNDKKLVANVLIPVFKNAAQ